MFEGPLKQRLSGIKTLPAFKVFYVLPDYLTFTEFRTLRQEDLVAELKVAQGSVSRALSELEALGIIERKGTGPVTQWRLSMDWGWRGNVSAYHKAKRERAEPKRPKLSVVHSEPPSAA